MSVDYAKLVRNYWGGAGPSAPPPPPGVNNTSRIVKELEAAIKTLSNKGNKANQANRNAFKAKLAAYRAIPAVKRALLFPTGLRNYGNNGFPKLKGELGFIAQAIGQKTTAAKQNVLEFTQGLNPFQIKKLEQELRNAKLRGNTARANNIQRKLNSVEQQAAAKRNAAAKRAAAERNAAAKRAAAAEQKKQLNENKASAIQRKKDEKEALRKAVTAALIVLNTKRNSVNTNNRAAYVKAVRNYMNAGYNVMANRTLGANRYSTTTGLSRKPSVTSKSKTFNTSSAFLSNIKKRLASERNSKKRQALLDEAIANLNKRLMATSRNGNALVLIGNYTSLSSNANYTSRLKRREEQRKTKKNEKEKEKKNGNGWKGGGQQIIFGGQPGGGAAPVAVQGGAAPVPVAIAPAPGGGAPIIVPGPSGGSGGSGPSVSVGGATGPSISVNPTIRVNVPQAAAQAAMQTLPSAERSALNNAGGYRRAASLISNAGGPETVSRALNALNQSNGNVQKAMRESGLPSQVFTNVNKLGGPTSARRTVSAVTKVNSRVPSSLGRALTSPPLGRVPSSLGRALTSPPLGRALKVSGRGRGRGRGRGKKKKRVVSACAACKMRPANKLKTIVGQLSRKNLEKNLLTCLLP